MPPAPLLPRRSCRLRAVGPQTRVLVAAAAVHVHLLDVFDERRLPVHLECAAGPQTEQRPGRRRSSGGSGRGRPGRRPRRRRRARLGAAAAAQVRVGGVRQPPLRTRLLVLGGPRQVAGRHWRRRAEVRLVRVPWQPGRLAARRRVLETAALQLRLDRRLVAERRRPDLAVLLMTLLLLEDVGQQVRLALLQHRVVGVRRRPAGHLVGAQRLERGQLPGRARSRGRGQGRSRRRSWPQGVAVVAGRLLPRLQAAGRRPDRAVAAVQRERRGGERPLGAQAELERTARRRQRAERGGVADGAAGRSAAAAARRAQRRAQLVLPAQLQSQVRLEQGAQQRGGIIGQRQRAQRRLTATQRRRQLLLLLLRRQRRRSAMIQQHRRRLSAFYRRMKLRRNDDDLKDS